MSPTRSWYSSNIISRSASRMRWRMTCLAVCAAMRPKSCGRDVDGRRRRRASERLPVDLGLRLLLGQQRAVVRVARLRRRRVLGHLDRAQQVVLEEVLLGDLRGEHPEVAGVPVDLDLDVGRGVARLAVGGPQGLLERRQQHLGVDLLLLLELVHGIEDVLVHWAFTGFQTTLDLPTAESGMSRALALDLHGDRFGVGREQPSRDVRAAVDRLLQAHLDGAADHPREVRGPHQRALQAGRRHLQGVALAERRERAGDGLARGEVDTALAVDAARAACPPGAPRPRPRPRARDGRRPRRLRPPTR